MGRRQHSLVSKRTPIHAPGQDHVSEQQIDLLVPVQRCSSAPCPSGSFQNRVAELPQRFGRVGAVTSLFVLNDKDRLALASRHATVLRRRIDNLFLGSDMAGQVIVDRGTLAELAVDADIAAGLPHKAVDLAQAKAGALARLLGREEGVEDLRLVALSMPEPVSVTATRTYCPGGTGSAQRLDIGIVEAGIARSRW